VSKDVSCQTSDCEVIPKKKKSEVLTGGSRSPSVEGRKKFYSDHRRATDSLVSSTTRPEGGNRLTVGKITKDFFLKNNNN
jgi:hypothetical protein